MAAGMICFLLTERIAFVKMVLIRPLEEEVRTPERDGGRKKKKAGGR